MTASFVVHKDSTTASSALVAASFASSTAFDTLAATNKPLKKPQKSNSMESSPNIPQLD